MNAHPNSSLKALRMRLVGFALASLIHFVHNAEFLADYPGLPLSWTRALVYGAWLALSVLGLAGWFATRAGYPLIGLVLLGCYAAGGLDSLGHYALAPMTAHSVAMNVTILLEVGAAALLLVEVLRRFVYAVRARGEFRHPDG